MSFLIFWLILFVPVLLAAIGIKIMEYVAWQCEMADERARRKHESLYRR